MSWGTRVRDGALAAFWTWLSLRLLNDWLGGVVVPAGQSFIPPGPFADAASAIRDVATSLGVVGTPIRWVADLLGGAAFALQFSPELAASVWLTMILTVFGIAFGLVIAVPLAAARVYGHVLKYVALAYIELIRGTPLLAQLFVLYFGLNLAGVFAQIPGVGTGPIPQRAVWVAVVGFTINSAAYQAEYFRGAIESVDPGQLTAARAVGLGQVEGIRHVVLPQALRYAIPSWTNELVYLIKYSSLASVITVPELYFTARSVASQNFRFLSMFLLAAAFYLALVVSVTTGMDWVRREVAIPGVGTSRGR